MNNELKIFAVIELNANEFTEYEYPFPNGSCNELPEDWRLYWKKCLKDSNLVNLDQIIIGEPFVDISTISDEELKIIIQHQLKDTNIDDVEEILSFEGGVVVSYDGVNITPQCCTSINDFENWQKIIYEKPKDWQQVWIGHPWIFSRFKDNHIEFSDYVETNDYSKSVRLIIDFISFQTAFMAMLKSIEAFRIRIECILKQEGYKNPSRIAMCLVNKVNFNEPDNEI